MSEVCKRSRSREAVVTLIVSSILNCYSKYNTDFPLKFMQYTLNRTDGFSTDQILTRALYTITGLMMFLLGY